MKTFYKVIFLSAIISSILFAVSCKKSTQSFLVGKWDRVIVENIDDTVIFETWEFTSDKQLFIDCSRDDNYIDSLNYKGVLDFNVDSRNKFTVSNGLHSDQWEIVLRQDKKIRIVHNYGEDEDIQRGLISKDFVKE